MKYSKKPDWHLPEAAATPKSVYLNRRTLLAAAGFGTLTLAVGKQVSTHDKPEILRETHTPGNAFPGEVHRNPAYAEPGPGRQITDEILASTYNNFYEFGSHKKIYKKAQRLRTDEWKIEVGGLVDNPETFSTDDLMKLPMEERVIRHRCVEAWSMVVPWIGFPLAALLRKVSPQGSAKYVKFESFLDTEIAPDQKSEWYPWPYMEGVTLAEAVHPLSFMVMGVYGEILPKQYGAPVRLHQPWKYGFKAIKSLTKITLTEERPVSFWEKVNAKEYGFWANVNPEVPHPRWSQATERPLGREERIPTLRYNGYEAEVAGLYSGMEEKLGRALFY